VNSEDIRSRYRRDFTSEPIRPNSPGSNSAPKPPQVEQVHHAPTASPEPAITTEPAFEKIEPIIQPVAQPARANQVKHSRKNGKKLLAVLIILLCVAAASTAAYIYHQNSSEVIPAKIKSQTNLPILYPSKLPPGYKVIKSSFNVTSGNVVAYYASDSKGNHINFTVQPRPKSFDFDKFYTQIMSDTTRFNTPAGEAVIGKANDKLLGSLATTSSWLLVTGSSNKVDASNLQTALSGVKVSD
jgi:hypothetical protein